MKKLIIIALILIALLIGLNHVFGFGSMLKGYLIEFKTIDSHQYIIATCRNSNGPTGIAIIHKEDCTNSDH